MRSASNKKHAHKTQSQPTVGTQSPGSSPTAVNPPVGDTIHPSQSNPEIAASQRAAAATGEEEHVERAPLSVDVPPESEEAAQELVLPNLRQFPNLI